MPTAQSDLTNRFNLRMSQDQVDALRAFCAKHGVTGSDVIRAALQHTLESGELPTAAHPDYQFKQIPLSFM